MTAPSAAADPLPPFHIGAIYAPTSEKEEAWVPQALRPRIPKKSHPTRHGTHHAVAPPVEKFPFRPHDNRRHDGNRRHKPNRSAAAAIATATAPAPISTTSILPPNPSYPEDALNRAFDALHDDLQALIQSEMQLLLSSMSNLLAQSFLPEHPKKKPHSATSATRRKPIERNRKARDNGKNSAKLSSERKPQLTTTTPTPPTPYSPPIPLKSVPPPPPPSNTTHDTPTTATQVSSSTDNLNPPTLPTAMPPPTTTTTQPTTTQSDNPRTPSPLPALLSITTTHAPANPPKPICLSMIERLIYNTTPANAALWTPDALHQHPVQRRFHIPHLPAYHSATNAPPRRLTTLDSPDDRCVGFGQPLTTLPPPAPDPPDADTPSRNAPIHHPHGQVTGPTGNLYPTPTALTRHHHPPPYLPLAQNVKAFAQNMRPP